MGEEIYHRDVFTFWEGTEVNDYKAVSLFIFPYPPFNKEKVNNTDMFLFIIRAWKILVNNTGL